MHCYKMTWFSFVNISIYLIPWPAFTTGKWISATVFECTCNYTGIPNEKLSK